MDTSVREQIAEAVDEYRDALAHITHPAQFTSEHQAVRTLAFVKALATAFELNVKNILVGSRREPGEGDGGVREPAPAPEVGPTPGDAALPLPADPSRAHHPSTWTNRITSPAWPSVIDAPPQRTPISLDGIVLPFEKRKFSAEGARAAAAASI